MPAVPYFFALKSLAELAIFNRVMRGAVSELSIFRAKLADVGNFGARPLGLIDRLGTAVWESQDPEQDPERGRSGDRS